MAGKRSATSDLNHENWNKEEEPEEAGTFKKASDDIIKTRVIKTAKRRNPISSVRSEENKNTAFQAFTGFSKAPAPPSNAFSFLSNLSKSEQPKTNGTPQTNDSTATSSKVTTFTIESNKKPTTDAANSNVSKQTNIKSDDYYAKLKGLNESVSKWIKQHVDENPFVSLQPIFKDYEKYFEELENECKNSKNNESAATSQTKSATDTKDDVTSSSGFASFAFKPASKTPLEKPAEKANPTWSFGVSSTTEPKESSKLSSLSKESKKPSTVTEMPKFTFGSSNSSSSLSSLNKSEAETPKFTFGSGNSNASTSSVKKTEAEAPSFSFGTTTTTTTTASAFQLGGPTFSFAATAPSTSSTGFSFPKPSTSMPGFTFKNVSKPESSENQNEEEDEEPPKNDFTPVVEDGHVYTTKCKVFVKKDKAFTDRGVGNLYLKPVPDSEKTQLIVRADTNLGNLLCNFLLSDSIPMQRMGKKDVMLVCLPMPDFKPPPVPILLRVKSPEDADELLDTLKKYKK